MSSTTHDNKAAALPGGKPGTHPHEAKNVDEVALPIPIPAAKPPRRTLLHKQSTLVVRIIRLAYLFTAISIAVFCVTSVANVLVGLMLVGAFEAVLERSWASVPSLFRLMTYWPYLKASWFGGAALSIVVGPVASIAFASYRLYRKGSRNDSLNNLRNSEERGNAMGNARKLAARRAIKFYTALISEALSTATIPAAVLANRWWWNDEGIAAVGENLIRSTLIVFVGGVVNSGRLLYTQWPKAEEARIELPDEEGVPLAQEPV